MLVSPVAGFYGRTVIREQNKRIGVVRHDYFDGINRMQSLAGKAQSIVCGQAASRRPGSNQTSDVFAMAVRAFTHAPAIPQKLNSGQLRSKLVPYVVPSGFSVLRIETCPN